MRAACGGRRGEGGLRKKQEAREAKGRESGYRWKEDNDGKGDGWRGRRGVSRGGGAWSVYPALSSRRPLWSWVGCEGGVRRREEEEDGEEEEGPRPGPRLTPQTVKWDLQQMKQRRSNQISLEVCPPPTPQHTQIDWRGWADGWCDLMKWRAEEVRLYNRKWCECSLKQTASKAATVTAMTSSALSDL